MKANQIFRNSESTNRYLNQRQQQTNALRGAEARVKFRVKQHNCVGDYNDDEILSMDIYSNSQ